MHSLLWKITLLFLSASLWAETGRISYTQKGFSIIPPQNWEVYSDYPQTSLMMQIPYQKGVYQRTIQVLRFAGATYVYDGMKKTYADNLTERYKKSLLDIKNYQIKSIQNVKIEGSNALFLLGEFSLNGIDLMHAHLLLSSSSYHYLLTYTDTKSHFKDPQHKKIYKEALASMLSIRLDSYPHGILFDILKYLIPIFVLVFLVGRFLFSRKRKSYDLETETEDHPSDDEKTS